MKRNINVLILAAGEGRRMGRGRIKQLLPFRGRPLLETVLRKFTGIPGIRERIVVLGYRADEIRRAVPPGFRVVLNKNYTEGMTSSLKMGISSMGSKKNSILFMPFDYPLLNPRTIRKLIHTHLKNPGKITVPSIQNRKGHPVIFDSSFVPLLKRVNPARGAREILYRNRDKIVFCPTRSRGVLVDVDTPREYQKIICVLN